MEDTLSEIRSAIIAYLADLKACGKAIPKPQQITIVSIAVPV